MMEVSDDEIFDNLSITILQNMTEPNANKKPRKRAHIKTSWSTESVFKLISAVEKFPCLWEYSSPHYKDRQRRDEAWTQVAIDCAVSDKEDCKTKWANIKTGYSHAKKKFETKSWCYAKDDREALKAVTRSQETQRHCQTLAGRYCFAHIGIIFLNIWSNKLKKVIKYLFVHS